MKSESKSVTMMVWVHNGWEATSNKIVSLCPTTSRFSASFLVPSYCLFAIPYCFHFPEENAWWCVCLGDLFRVWKCAKKKKILHCIASWLVLERKTPWHKGHWLFNHLWCRWWVGSFHMMSWCVILRETHDTTFRAPCVLMAAPRVSGHLLETSSNHYESKAIGIRVNIRTQLNHF